VVAVDSFGSVIVTLKKKLRIGQQKAKVLQKLNQLSILVNGVYAM